MEEASKWKSGGSAKMDVEGVYNVGVCASLSVEGGVMEETRDKKLKGCRRESTCDSSRYDCVVPRRRNVVDSMPVRYVQGVCKVEAILGRWRGLRNQKKRWKRHKIQICCWAMMGSGWSKKVMTDLPISIYAGFSCPGLKVRGPAPRPSLASFLGKEPQSPGVPLPV